MRRAIIIALFLALPSVSSAAAFSPMQISAIVELLRAFSVDLATVARVEQILGAAAAAVPINQPVATDAPAPHVPPIGSLYPPGSVGYDLSYATHAYPQIPFGFAIVGVTGGKAFVHNSRFSSEYAWAQFGSTQPTLYMNINAPYGTTVAGHIGTPRTCAPRAATSTTSSIEPTACEGYNYGYHAAEDAYAYAAASRVYSPLWWLDVEEANSWSADTAVNDATIQGAVDYLNLRGVRVGVYSTPRMWREIAGSDFVPAQIINGQSVTVPTWLPVGIDTQIGALNTCVTDTSFMRGSPLWIVQYVADSTAVDQGIAC